MDLKELKLKGGDKKMIKTKIKQEKGITLIALVVTIVVLLILAGITITALFGDNGLITRALQVAKEGLPLYFEGKLKGEEQNEEEKEKREKEKEN